MGGNAREITGPYVWVVPVDQLERMATGRETLAQYANRCSKSYGGNNADRAKLWTESAQSHLKMAAAYRSIAAERRATGQTT